MRTISIMVLVWTVTSICALAGPLADTLRIGYTTAVPFILPGAGHQGISWWLWEQMDDLVDDRMVVFEEIPFADLLRGLHEGDIDMTVNPLTLTPDRHQQILFSQPFYVGYTSIAVVRRSELARLMSAVRATLNLDFLRGFMLLVGIVLFFALLTWRFEYRKNPQMFRPGWPGIWDGIWWSVVTLTTVGYGDKAPRSRGGKIVALFWMFSGLLFISGFTASIASSFTVTRLQDVHETIESFKSRHVGVVENTSTASFLRHEFFRDVEAYGSLEACLQALDQGEIDAVFYDESILRYRIDQADDDHLEVLPLRFNQQFVGLGFSRDEGMLRDRVSQRLLEIINSSEWDRVLEEFDLNVGR